MATYRTHPLMELYKRALKIGEIQEPAKDVLIFSDFDDTLFWRENYSKLLQAEKFEEASSLPKTPMPKVSQMLSFFKDREVRVIVVTKQGSDNEILRLLGNHGLETTIERVLCQYDIETISDAGIKKTTTVSKGEIIRAFLEDERRETGRLPRFLIFVDDIDVHIESVRASLEHFAPSLQVLAKQI